MHHPNTQRFTADWRMRRGGRPLPHRRDLDPALFGALAPQLFMLGVEGGGADVFRLAGGLLIDLHGRELAGSAFQRLWARREREVVGEAVARSLRIAAPLVLSAEGATAEGNAVGLEITLAPVLGPSGDADRIFGLYQPTSPLARLHGRALAGLTLQAVEAAAEPRPPHLRLVVSDGRRVA